MFSVKASSFSTTAHHVNGKAHMFYVDLAPINCSLRPVIRLQSDDIQETLCKGCGLCEDCTYEEPEKVPTCSVALDNSISPGGYSTTIEDLLIEPGYWRATSTSEKVLACYNVDACNGGLTSALDYCYKGYEGPCKRLYASSA